MVYKKKTPKLSQDSKELAGILMPCKTKEHLDLWLRSILGVSLAPQKVSRFATTCPLDLAWEVYSYGLDPTQEKPLKIMAIGARGSQKTLVLAVLDVLFLIHMRRDVIHYAATGTQAAAGFNYISRFLTNQYLRQFLTDKPSKEKIALGVPKWDDLSDIKEVKVEVFPITPGNAESRHVSVLSIDELGSLDNAKRNTFNYLSGIPITSDEGHPPIILQISSRKGSATLIEEQIEKAQETDLKVHSWTSFEMTKGCSPSRYGDGDVEFYGAPTLGKIVTPEEYEVLSEKIKLQFQKTKGKTGCLSCPLSSSCLSDAIQQKSTLSVLNSIEKTIFDMKQVSIELWAAQRMALAPTKEGSIYSTFNIERHCKSERDILNILNVPEGQKSLIAYLKKQKYPVFAGIDHSGGTAEGSIGIAFVDEKGRIFFIDYYSYPGLDIDRMIVKLKEFDEKYDIKIIFPDPAAADKNRALERAGFTVVADIRRSVSYGIDLVRSYLLNHAGETNMFLLRGATDPLASDMLKYRFKSKVEGIYSDDPAEENSHGPDQMRYLIQNIVERNYRGVKVTIETPEEIRKDPMSEIRRSMQDAFKKHLSDKGITVDEDIISDGGIKFIV